MEVLIRMGIGNYAFPHWLRKPPHIKEHIKSIKDFLKYQSKYVDKVRLD